MIISLNSLKKKYSDFSPSGVLHIGASEGQEAGEYYQSGISKMIFVEAIPDIFLKLKSNISKYPDAVALNACFSDKEEEIEFKITNNGGQSSSILELSTHKTAHPDVIVTDIIKMNTVRAENFLKSVDLSGVDFLNIDVQGAELMVLRGMGELLKQFKWAYLEVNQDELYHGCAMIDDVDLFMISFGFYRTDTKIFTNWGWGDAFYQKKKW